MNKRQLIPIINERYLSFKNVQSKQWMLNCKLTTAITCNHCYKKVRRHTEISAYNSPFYFSQIASAIAFEVCNCLWDRGTSKATAPTASPYLCIKSILYKFDIKSKQYSRVSSLTASLYLPFISFLPKLKSWRIKKMTPAENQPIIQFQLRLDLSCSFQRI